MFETKQFIFSLSIVRSCKSGSNVPNKPGFYDYSMINVAWCSNLEVIEEPSETPEPLPNLNIQKVNFIASLALFDYCFR